MVGLYFFSCYIIEIYEHLTHSRIKSQKGAVYWFFRAFLAPSCLLVNI